MLALPAPPGWEPAPFSLEYTHPSRSHPGSFQSTFPVEIYERIIDFCAHPANFPNALRDCRLTLRTWALTCKALLRRVRFHLWREIKLRDEKEVNALTQTLRRNSHLSTFIQFLDVWMDAPASMFITLVNAKMRHLQYMHISGERPLRHKLFFQTMFQFKMVTMLWISFRIQAHQFMRLLCCFPNLLLLKLDGEQDCYAPIPEATKYAPKFKLECFQFKFSPEETHVEAWRYILRCLMNTQRCLTTLRILEVDFSDTWDGVHVDMENISLILSSAGETLTDLVIHYTHDWNFKEPGDTHVIKSISLQHNSALRRLRIAFYWTGQKDLSGLLHLLESIPEKSLEYLSILFSQITSSSEGVEIEAKWWQDLDTLLSTDRFQNLRGLDITPTYERFGDEMAVMKKKGIVHVTSQRMFPARDWMRLRGFWL